MRCEVEFYRTVTGDEPALEYIRAQVKAHRAKIGRALSYLEEVGHEARRPAADYLGESIYELRIGVDGHQHRLLYFFHGRTLIVVTGGFLKKAERVPTEELVRARRCRLDWIARYGGES